TIDQIGRSPRRKLIEGEDSTDKEKLGSAAAQYNMLRNNFRGLPSTDPEEDRCHYKYMDLRRRASDWRWPHRVADWVFLKWCWGYGIYTYRIVATIALVIFGFGALYHVAAGPATIRNYYVTSGPDALPDIQTAEADPQTEFSPWYFSIITFTTIGYGDYAPRGWLRWFAGVEGLMGLLLMAVFTVSFARKFIR
ncbi:MAG: two pore domain potassium channel family protein, partial [Phycisphaerales bacterium]